VNVIDGTQMNLGGLDFVVPPLTLAQTRKFHLDGKLAKLPWSGPQLVYGAVENGEAFLASLAVTSEIVAAAIGRNHADVTADAVLDLLDLGNLEAVMKAVLGAAGLARNAPGEAKSP
jgi:hypothetical protein